MNTWVSKVLLLVSLLVAFAPATISQSPDSAPHAGSLVRLKVHSPSLAGNKLGDPADQEVIIYLPPSYSSDSGRQFPTLYLLHGSTSEPAVWINGEYQGMNLRDTMDSLLAEGKAKEMIVVMPNGSNKYLSSFYTNSVVTGNWEDYIVRDVVGYVDDHYRTIASSGSRGIAGHSMGGYGAIMLGMKHPDVFGAVYALSPCCVAMTADLTSENPAWHAAIAAQANGKLFLPPHGLPQFFATAFVAAGAAWSPNEQDGPLFVNLPYREEDGKLVASEPALKQWHEHMPLYIAEKYRQNLLLLRGIYLDYGFADEFKHIPVAVRDFSQVLARLQVPHILAGHGGDHTERTRERFETAVVPFFSQVMETGTKRTTEH